MKTNFTREQNKILTEIYRRLNYFHSGNLNTKLLYLGMLSDAKKLKDFNLITPASKEISQVLNWYSLTDKGKVFFANYVTKWKLDNKTNSDIFNGSYVKTFDYNLIK